MDVLEHRMEGGRLEQRMYAAVTQTIDQRLQVVLNVQRVGGLDLGRGDPRLISVGAKRATGERLQVQCRHFMDSSYQVQIQLAALTDVSAHVGHAVSDPSRGEYEPGR